MTGLVHISEVSYEYVKDIKDLFTLGDTVKVKVLKIEDGGKVVLSMKRATEQDGGMRPAPRGFAPRPSRDRVEAPTAPATFEDKLAKFLKDSEDIQLDAKRSLDLSKKRKKEN